MIRRLSGGVVAILIGLAAFGTAGAEAAAEIGSDCEGDSFLIDPMAAQSSRVTPPAALETTAPGVVTSWRVTSSTSAPGEQFLKVFKRVGGRYRVLAESGLGARVQGRNVFPTRIPVAAGTSFGTAASSGFIPACGGATGDAVARFDSAPAVGGEAEPELTTPSMLLALMG